MARSRICQTMKLLRILEFQKFNLSVGCFRHTRSNKKKKTRQKSPRIPRSQIRLFKFNLFLFVRMFPAMYSYTENALGDQRNSDHIEASYNTDSKQTNSPRPAVAESQVETTTRGSLRQVFCLLFLFFQLNEQKDTKLKKNIPLQFNIMSTFIQKIQ